MTAFDAEMAGAWWSPIAGIALLILAVLIVGVLLEACSRFHARGMRRIEDDEYGALEMQICRAFDIPPDVTLGRNYRRTQARIKHERTAA